MESLILRSALLKQGPSYHEFITAIQYQLLWDIWRVPSMAITVSGVPQGCMFAPFKFLLALLRTEGASACKHGPFVQPALMICCRAALQAAKTRRVSGLCYTRACGGRSGMEAKAPGSGRGGRGWRVEVWWGRIGRNTGARVHRVHGVRLSTHSTTPRAFPLRSQREGGRQHWTALCNRRSGVVNFPHYSRLMLYQARVYWILGLWLKVEF